MTHWKLSLFTLCCLTCACCTPLLELEKSSETFGLSGTDLTPPVLLAAGAPDGGKFLLEFNEEVAAATLEALVPSAPGAILTVSGSLVAVATPEGQLPGREYALDLVVRDRRGNSQQLLVRCYGFNARIPAMLINEFTTQGSSSHPDMVELLVKEAGNLAGACLYEGVPDNWAQRLVFPDCEVDAGEFLIIHFKPEGLPEEFDETGSIDLSEGLDASDEARDFWVPDGSGLSGNNGVIALFRDPFGVVLDAVVYSNRTSDSDERYRGFGSSAVLERVDAIAATGAWVGESGLLRPEDAVDPEDSTATRSICRGSDSADSDTRNDWHIVPTSTLSFGSVNSDEIYQP